ncbi:MAG: hypothetical protein JSU00_30515 [Acidobacteria bacterium]|nr:hypothetical protein [Acidobacteriota bacterium]
MLHAIILAVGKESAEAMVRIVQRSGHIKVDSVFAPAESAHHFVLKLNGLSPELVLIEMGDDRNASYCSLVRERAPEAIMLGFSTREPAMVDPVWPSNPTEPREPWPLTPSELVRIARRGYALRYPGPFDNLVAMLPAKAGCGASTTLLNVAGKLDQSFQKRVLVVDGDLRSGALAETLNTTPTCSVAHTLADSYHLPTLMWNQQVLEQDGVHLMPSRRDACGPLPQWYEWARLMRFAASRYDMVMVDLPEVINDASAEVVRLARAVYVVTTPELPALQLARSRIAELNDVQPDADRIRILINRWHRSDVHPRDVAKALGRRVEAVLPNDYLSVKKAILRNGYVDAKTSLGAAYGALAGFLVNAGPPPMVEEPKSKLLAAFVPAQVQIRRRTA